MNALWNVKIQQVFLSGGVGQSLPLEKMLAREMQSRTKRKVMLLQEKWIFYGVVIFELIQFGSKSSTRDGPDFLKWFIRAFHGVDKHTHIKFRI